MEKKSKVKQTVFKKSGNGTNGEYFIFEIEFENGDKGSFFSKTKEALKEGQEVEYTIEEKTNGQYTNKIVKLAQKGFVQGKGNPKYEHKRVALKCGVDLACAGKIEVKQIASYADSFMKFLDA